jgi:hypothetical protein
VCARPVTAGRALGFSHAKGTDPNGSLSAALSLSLLRNLPFIGTEAMGKGL